MKTPLGPQQEDGFALPIAVGVGIVMILIATTMVIRSNQGQVASIQQRSNHRSLAAAETGIAKYQSLLNQYREFIATSAEAWRDRREDIQSRPGCASTTTLTSVPPTLPTPPGPSDTMGYAHPQVAYFFDPVASQEDDPATTTVNEERWVPIDIADPKKGRFRLVDYVVNPNFSFATMTVEGAEESKIGNSVTALTRLEVRVPIGGDSISQSIAGTPSPDCSFPALDFPIKSSTSSPLETPLEDFVFSEFNEDGSDNVSLTTQISGSITSDETFPRSSEAQNLEHYVYLLQGNPAINLSLPAGSTVVPTLTIASGKKVYWVVDNDIIIDKGQIELEANAQLFIISSANVTLIQAPNSVKPVVFSAASSQPAASESFQIFLTGIDDNPSTSGDRVGELKIDVGDTSYPSPAPRPLSFVAFAPDGSVSLNKVSTSTETSFEASIWARDFSLSLDPPGFNPVDVNPPELPLFWDGRLDRTRFSKRIGAINSWKKIDVP